jgi:hypothetical protein
MDSLYQQNDGIFLLWYVQLSSIQERDFGDQFLLMVSLICRPRATRIVTD